MMRRRIVLILAVIILGSAFSIWWTLGQPRIYEATAVAQIESPTVADPAASGVVTANPRGPQIANPRTKADGA